MTNSDYNEIRMDGVRFDVLTRDASRPFASRIANASYCYLVQSGEAVFDIQDGDPLRIVAKAGDVLAVSGLTRHLVHVGGVAAGPPQSLVNSRRPIAEVDQEDAALYVGEVNVAELAFLGAYVGSQHIKPENHKVFNERIWRALRIIEEETRARDDHYEVAVRLLSETILLNVMRFVEHTQGSGVSSLNCSLDKRLMRVMLEIGKDPTRPWTVAELASLANMSRTAFATGFHKLMRVTPMEAVTHARLARGIFALDNTRKSIEEIGFCCGYSSSSAFVRAFRRNFHITPLQRRKFNRD